VHGVTPAGGVNAVIEKREGGGSGLTCVTVAPVNVNGPANCPVAALRTVIKPFLTAELLGPPAVSGGMGPENPTTAGVTPVPVSVAVNGAASPAPWTVSVAERGPVAVGVNVTLIVQDEPAPGGGGKVVPQVPPAAPPGRANSPGVVGEIGGIVTTMPPSGTVPVLVNVNVCDALVVVSTWIGKAAGVDRVAVGGTMVPVSATDCGDRLPMFTFIVAVREFGGTFPVGRNVTLIVQVAAGNTDPQVLDGLLNPPPAGEKVIPLLIERVVLPVLVTTTY
jgi:hypothetical protein